MASSEAAFRCGICDENYVQDLKVFSCGHIVCKQCLQRLKQDRQFKKTCPYCRTSYTTEPYPLFPDLHVVPGGSTTNIILKSRQRVVHMINELGIESQPEDIRNAYNVARQQRAAIRNLASGSKDSDFETLVYALTEAVDALEDRLHYSLQKQDLADKYHTAKSKLKEAETTHKDAIQVLRGKIVSLKSQRDGYQQSSARAANDVLEYKRRLEDAAREKNLQTKRANEKEALAEELKHQLEDVNSQSTTFQSQLHDFKRNETKYKAQIRELKDQLKALKSEEKRKQQQPQTPSKVQTKPVFKAPRPDSPSLELITSQNEIINLITDDSSPASDRVIRSPPKPHRQHGKRSRESDENQYDTFGEMGSDPVPFRPPKVRGHEGLLRMRNEVMEQVSVKPNGAMKSKPVTLGARPHRDAMPLPTVEVSTSQGVGGEGAADRGKAPVPRKHKVKSKGGAQLLLGADGKLVVGKKRLVRAL